MVAEKEAFPQRLQLWRGVILATIAHAIWVASNPDFSHEQSWDGFNYSVQNSMGSRGTITFAENKVVGVFFDKDSPRNPFLSTDEYKPHFFLKQMPTSLLKIATDEALQYVLQRYRGEVTPVITAAFWSEGEYLTAGEPWSEVFNHGAHLIDIQVQDTETAINRWQAEYELSPEQVKLMRALFSRKMTSTDEHQIFLDEAEYQVLVANGDEGLGESKELLAAIGIFS